MDQTPAPPNAGIPTIVKVAAALWTLLVLGLLSWVVLADHQIQPKSPVTLVLGILVIGPLLLFGEELFELVLVNIGRGLVRVFSLGHARLARPEEEAQLVFHRGWSRARDGRLVCSDGWAAFFGISAPILMVMVTALLRG